VFRIDSLDVALASDRVKGFQHSRFRVTVFSRVQHSRLRVTGFSRVHHSRLRVTRVLKGSAFKVEGDRVPMM